MNYKLEKAKLFLLPIYFLLLPFIVFSQTNTWTDGNPSNSNWQNGQNWSLGHQPTSSEDVVININTSIDVNTTTEIKSLTVSGNVIVTLQAKGSSAREITINNNGSSIAAGNTLNITGQSGSGTRTLTISFKSGGTRTMTIAGTLNVNITSNQSGVFNTTHSATTVTGTVNNNGGTITSTTANLSFSAGSTYNHQTDGNGIPVATWNAASNCNITGFISNIPSNLNQSFGNFNWSCSGQSGGAYFAEALTTVNGNFTVDNTGLYGLYLAETNNSTYSLHIVGNLTINNNAWLVMVYGQSNNAYGDNVTATVNVGGNFSMTGADSYFDYWPFHATGSGLSLNKLTLNVTGNYSQSGGVFDFAGGNSDVNNFTELKLGGDLSLTGTGVIQTSTPDVDIINGTITFTKNGTQTVYAEVPSNFILTNFIVAANSSTELKSHIILSSSNNANWAGKFTVNNGGILDAENYQIVSSSDTAVGENNSFTLNAGAGIISANQYGVHEIGYTGPTISDALASNTFSSAANYTYNGTAIQNSGTFITTPTANQVNNLTINNTAGNTTTGVTLQQPMAVAGTLTLTEGLLTTDATNLLTMNAGSSVYGANYGSRASGGSQNSFVNGPMKKIGNTDFLFPVGKINRGHHYCGISAPSNATDAFQAEYIIGSATNLGSITASGLDHVSHCEYWNIDKKSGSSVNVTLSWNPQSICNMAAYVTDPTSLVVAHFGTSWDSYGNDGGYTGNVSTGSVTWNSVSTFSPFSLGSTDPAENPLPVKLINVKAYQLGSVNKIEWTNLTEFDVEKYEVEKSTDGIRFVLMTTTTPKANAGGSESYDATDVQPLPVNFYRVKVTAINGEISYSQVMKLTNSQRTGQKISLYPNPVTQNQFTIQMTATAGKYSVRIINAAGQLIQSSSIIHTGGSVANTIDLPRQIQSGIYYLQINGEQQKFSTTFLVQ